MIRRRSPDAAVVARPPPTALDGKASAPPASARWLSRADLASVLALVAVTMAFFSPLILPGALRRRVVEGDFSHQFFPFRAFEAHEWWAGRVPLWNPDMFAGHPFQADVQTAVFYPIALANALLFGWRDFPYVALEGEIVVHTALAAAFTYLLARRLTGSRFGGLVAGAAFALGGFLTSYPEQQLPILETSIWLPLTVLLLHLATEGPAPGRPVVWHWLGLAGACFGVALLAGHTQTALFVVYATEGYLAFRLIAGRSPLTGALAALAAYPAVAALVAAIQLLPSLQLFQLSTRDEMDYAAAAYGYLPSALWQVFVPLWHGEKALSVGVGALALAVVGAWAARREPLAYWGVVGLIALPLSTGGATPLFWLLFHLAPGWDLFRDQERSIYLFSFAVALLAGRGAAEIWRRADRRLLARVALAVGVGAIVALLFWVLGPVLGEPGPLRANLALDAGVLATLAGLLYLGARRGGMTVPLVAGIVALVVVEAFALNFGNNLGPASPDPRPRLAATAAYVRDFPEPFRVATTSEATFPSNYGMLLGLPNVGGDTPFELRRMHDVLNSDAGWRLWQILNVKFAIGDPAATDGLKLVFQDSGLRTYFMQDSLPRAWAVRAVEAARDPAEAYRLILAPGYHPGNVVVLEQAPAAGPFSAGPRPDVEITRLEPQRVEIDANASGNAMLILAQQYYPDWQAYRDGQPVPTYRANYVAMAFDLPSGQHHFELVYRPTSFYAGVIVSLIAVLAVALGAARATGAWPFLTAFAAGLVARPNRTEDRARGVGLYRYRRLAWWIASLVLTALAFGLRVHDLGLPNLTADEWFMLRNHDEGPLWIIHQARTFEPHPLLYYLGLAGWVELAGRTELALRFPSVVFGVVLVPALMGLGRRLLGPGAGLAAGALAAINPYQIAQSQNARDYAVVTGLSAVASLLFIRALGRGGRGDWLAYGAAMFLALNTHYDAALVFAAHVAYLGFRYLSAKKRAWLLDANSDLAVNVSAPGPFPLTEGEGGGEGDRSTLAEAEVKAPLALTLTRTSLPLWRTSRPLRLPLLGRARPLQGRTRSQRERGSDMSRASSPVLRIGNSAWRHAIYTVGAVAVLFAVMLIYASPGLLAYHGYFPAAVGPEHVLARSLATFGLGTSASIGRAAPLFALALVGIVWLALRRTSVAVFLGLYALLPVALVSVLFAFRPMFDERYLIVLAPGYLLLLAAGLSALFGSPLTRPIGALAAVGVLALTIPTISGTYREMLAQRADYRGMAAWVSTYGGRDDPVVATGHGQADLFAYYSRGQPAPQVLDQPARLASTLPGLLAAGRGIWLLPYWQEPADVAALDLLKRDAVPVADGWFNNARALYFASASGLTLPSAARGTWDGQIALDGARLTGGPVQAGEALGVELHWKASAAMPTPKVSFRLLDANGDVVAQHDTTLAAADRVVPGEAVTRTGLFVPAIAAPGWYTAALLLYHPSGDSLRLATDYPSTDNLLTLGQIAVARHTRPVPPQAVVVGVRDNVVFPAGVTVMGHDPVGGSYVTGDTVTLRLVWRADRSGLPDLSRTLELRDPTGQAAATTTEPILASYTTSAWQAGQMIEERPRFRIPPTVGSGAYHLVLRVAPGGERSLDLGVIAVSGPDHSFARPTFSRPIGAQLGSFATLLGIDLDRNRVTPGTRLGLTLYWAARGAADRRYTLFIHLVDPSGQIRGQIDRPPLAGARPTDGWVAGEYLRDAYDPPLAADAPPGSYAVEVGLYDPATGARVPVVLADGSAADHVVVATVEVGP